MKRPLRALVIVILAAGPLHGEAWPRGKGQLFAHFGATSFSADTLFDTGGNRAPFPGRGFDEKGDNLYLELGLTDRFTALATLPLKKVVVKGLVNDFTSRGLADLDLRLRYSTRIGPGVYAGLDAGAFVPLGYDETEFPARGSGETDAVVSGSVGAGLRFLPEGFLSLDVGYRWRGGALADEIPYALKVGAFPHPRIGVFLFARGSVSRADFSRVDPFVGTTTDSERLLAGAELYARVSRHFDVNGSWAKVVRGRNTPIGDQLLLGVAFHTKVY